MVPNPSEVHRRRLFTAASLRFLAVLAALPMVVAPLALVAALLLTEDYFSLDEALGPVIFAGLAAAGCATLWALAPMLSRQMVPKPQASRCPGCGYSCEGLPTDRCPECSIRLPAEFFDVAAGPATSLSHEAFVRRCQIVVALIVRLVGILPLTFGIVLLVMAIVEFVNRAGAWDDRYNGPWDSNTVPTLTVWSIALLTLGIGGVFFQHRVARFILGGRATLAMGGTGRDQPRSTSPTTPETTTPASPTTDPAR